jgi:enoyl-CoA hydratase
MDSPDDSVLLSVQDGLGRITLNRPRAINAITLPMVQAMHEALRGWAQDDDVRAVLIDGAGERGLCAGGDIVAVYNSLLAATPAAEAYWRAEYELVETIAGYPKPYIALMDGLVLGGGVGVSAHGSLRIVTERSRVGLTQLNIGFVPDIGGSWLMARAPGRLGAYAGLTAAQLGPADAILCGLADVCVASESLPELTADLGRALAQSAPASRSAGGADGDPDAGGRAALDAALLSSARLHETPLGPGVLARDRRWIDEAFAAPDARAIIAELQGRDEPDARAAGSRLAALSPSSLREALALIRGAADLDLHDAIEAELHAALRVAAGPDLREGIRAQVIDKDRTPRWSADA